MQKWFILNSSAVDEHLLFLVLFPRQSSGPSLSSCFFIHLQFFSVLSSNLCSSLLCWPLHYHTFCTHQFIMKPCRKLLLNINPSAFCSPLSSPFPFAARSPGEQEYLGKRCKICLYLNGPLCASIFCVHLCLQCSLSAVLVVCLTPGFSFVPFFSNCSFFLH